MTRRRLEPWEMDGLRERAAEVIRTQWRDAQSPNIELGENGTQGPETNSYPLQGYVKIYDIGEKCEDLKAAVPGSKVNAEQSGSAVTFRVHIPRTQYVYEKPNGFHSSFLQGAPRPGYLGLQLALMVLIVSAVILWATR